MLKSIGHICFGTKDLKGTLAFYSDVFAAKLCHEFKNEAGDVYGVFLSLSNGIKLEFFNSSEPVAAGSPFRHFCLEVEDIQKIAQHLRTKGFNPEIKRGRTDRTLQFWIEDNNGIRIEFQQIDKESTLFGK